MEEEMGETVYGTSDEGHVMSEKVQSLASSVYKEFERMIKKYDEDVVKELMPLVVGILEGLDQAYADKQECEVELELLRDDNEQLLTQYEREKQLRRTAEQKYLEVEDAIEGEKEMLEEKVESMESIVRMLELKSKNSADHVSRLEDKEAEMKKEYTKLHERYTELFKTHMDYMERAKILMGPDRIGDLANSPRNRGSFQLPNLRPVNVIYGGAGETPAKSDGTPDFDMMSPNRSQDSNVSLRSEMRDKDSPESKDGGGKSTSDKSQGTDSINVRESATGTKGKEDTHSKMESQSNQSEPVKLNDATEDQSKCTSQSGSENVPQSNVVTPDRNSADPSKSVDIKVEEVAVEMRRKLSKSDSKKDRRRPRTHNLPHPVIVEEPPDSSPVTKSFLESEDFTESLGAPVHVLLERPALDKTISDIVATTPELEEMGDSLSTSTPNKRTSRRNNDSLFDELTPDVIGDVDFGADITGKEVHPGEYASSEEGDQDGEMVSDNFFVGMGKEVENLILENTELLATKNALNIVKDDLIAKVDELTSEQEILREEITSLQTVKSRLQLRITQLEEDLKKTKEELEKKCQEGQAEGEDDVPMAQRKRFTRVEMARVLMERNQYKERLMELQEAVRWTEMIRASREHPELVPKKKSGIWSFFGNLFSSSNKPSKRTPQHLPVATVKYNAPTTNVRPIGDPNKKRRDTYNLGEKAKAYDFLHDIDTQPASTSVEAKPEPAGEKNRRERERERREQYKQVRAHVKKDDGRMQAYGWSLPAKFTPQIQREQPNKSHVPVPVPVYCRPLLEKESGLKIWCAAGVNLTGGRTIDGGSIVGASVFYSNPGDDDMNDNKAQPNDEVEKLDRELKEHEKNIQKTENEQMSSFVWICTSTNSYSRVTVIDANNPGDLLESFRVASSHILSIASVPGAMESDYPRKEIPEWQKENLDSKQFVHSGEQQPNNKDDSGIGGITFVKCATGASSQNASADVSPLGSPPDSREMTPEKTKANLAKMTAAVQELTDSGDSNKNAPSDSNMGDNSSETYSEKGDEDPLGVKGDIKATILTATGSPPSSGATTPNDSSSVDPPETRMLHEPTELVKDGITPPCANDIQSEEIEKMSSVLPTMWMGCQSGSLYVHSSVAQWKRCLHSVKLGEAVLSIVHIKGRVLVGLADGTIAFFHRASDGQWDLRNYHILDFGRPRQSIRCMTIVANKHVWCGYKNIIHVIDPEHMNIVNTFDAHPRKESQVRQLAWIGDGVWVSIRLDSTLRLYHAYTHQHLQDVDIEPYVSKMLGTGKLGFSFVRITAMLIACKRLWIGTGNGVIISVPLSESNKQQITTGMGSGRPGGVIRVYSDNKNDSVTPGSFIPYCSMAQAQLSFHGHRDAVKFFSAVPGSPSKGMSAASEVVSNSSSKVKPQEATPAPNTQTKLVISGGEGYIDFRIGDGDEDEGLLPDEEEKKNSMNRTDRSHLIVWQVSGSD